MSGTQLAGRRLGGFVVEREIGSGGMGLVLLARQESLDRPVVLKRIHPDLVSDPELEARFEREAIAAGRLHHPNVVCVYDRFRHRGQPYLASEYVDGTDLSAILTKTARLPWRLAATIALEVARGLEAIHAEGTLHRDIKPQNLLIGRRGEVKIGDFGLALDASGGVLTRPGIALGTPPYMAPEQMRGDRVDPRADLFSLGVVLYEMLTGRTPYVAPKTDEEPALLEQLESGRHPRVRRHCRDAPRALTRLVRDCLRPKPPRRIASASEACRRLERLLQRPTHADCRHVLARFLWERRVFEPRATETVVMVAAEPAGLRARVRPAFAGAALATAAFALGAAWLEPERVLAVTDVVVGAVTRLP